MASQKHVAARALAVLLLLPGGAAAQIPAVSVNPVMTKGSADAPVTIVEFSDYQ